LMFEASDTNGYQRDSNARQKQSNQDR